MAFAVKPGQRLVFAGDSITDAGRRQGHAPLGDGYVRIVSDLIAARYPAHGVTILNAGVGGDTVRMLAARWDADVIDARPDWVTVLIGVNDAWWYLIRREGYPDPREYRLIYTDLLDRLRRRTRAKLVLIDPFLVGRIGEVKDDHRRVLEVLPRYRSTVAALARRFHARHIRLQRLFDHQRRHVSASVLAPDAVHPTRLGHAVIAHAWLRAMRW